MDLVEVDVIMAAIFHAVNCLFVGWPVQLAGVVEDGFGVARNMLSTSLMLLQE